MKDNVRTGQTVFKPKPKKAEAPASAPVKKEASPSATKEAAAGTEEGKK